MSIISILELAGVAHLPRSQQLIESVILVEGYKEAQVEFGSIAGEEQAKQTIDQFRDLVNRNQVQGNERNIDYWRKQGWDQFSAFVQEKSQEKSKTQIKRAKVEGDSIVLKETPEWLIVIPLDKDASCFHGKNTDWCTTKPFASYFEEYFYDKSITLIYFLKLNTGSKWAIAAHKDTDKIEMFDVRDTSISASTFKRQTGIDPIEFTRQTLQMPDVQEQTEQARERYRVVMQRIKDKMPFTKEDQQLEADLLFVKNPSLIVQYCRAVGKRLPAAEKFMLQNESSMMVYHETTFKDQRWPEAEKALVRLMNMRLQQLESVGQYDDDDEIDDDVDYEEMEQIQMDQALRDVRQVAVVAKMYSHRINDWNWPGLDQIKEMLASNRNTARVWANS